MSFTARRFILTDFINTLKVISYFKIQVSLTTNINLYLILMQQLTSSKIKSKARPNKSNSCLLLPLVDFITA